MKPLARCYLLVAVALLALPLLAFAQAAAIPDPGVDLDTFLKVLVSALTGGQWQLAGVLGMIGVIYLLKTFGTKIPGPVGVFLATGRGGALLAILSTLALGFGAVLVAGVPITAQLVLGIFGTAFTAIGGWVGVRRLLGLDIASKAAAQFQPAPATSAGAAAAELGKPPAP